MIAFYLSVDDLCVVPMSPSAVVIENTDGNGMVLVFLLVEPYASQPQWLGVAGQSHHHQ
jgi:hypothetical protein